MYTSDQQARLGVDKLGATTAGSADVHHTRPLVTTAGTATLAPAQNRTGQSAAVTSAPTADTSAPPVDMAADMVADTVAATDTHTPTQGARTKVAKEVTHDAALKFAQTSDATWATPRVQTDTATATASATAAATTPTTATATAASQSAMAAFFEPPHGIDL